MLSFGFRDSSLLLPGLKPSVFFIHFLFNVLNMAFSSATKTMPGLNHLFQTAQSGSPLEYEKIEEIIAPVALECIVEWMGKQD